MRDALMDAYKEEFGIDYQSDYQEKKNWLKDNLNIQNENQYADYLIEHDLLPNYDIAFGSDNKKNGKAENWEMFIEEKSVEKKLAEQATTKQNNGGNNNEKKEEDSEGSEGENKDKERIKKVI
jgi:hypothetical protein